MFCKHQNKMLSIFSCPRPFKGNTGRLQRNAIKSWTLLKPKPEIILIGDEEGVKEITEEFGCRYVPKIERNEYGTPSVRSIFSQAQKAAVNQLVCYINTDIILLSDFIQAIQKVKKMMGKKMFLLIGGRWEIKSIDINFLKPNWEEKAKRVVKNSARLNDKAAMDYFIFPKTIDWELPPFLLGRFYWDNWFCYKARAMKIPVIDISRVITVIHQNHDYPHFKTRKNDRSMKNTEIRYNFKLLGFGKSCIIRDATHKLTPEGNIKVNNITISFLIKGLREIKTWIIYYLRDAFYPYSYPLYLLLKIVTYPIKIAFRFFKVYPTPF